MLLFIFISYNSKDFLLKKYSEAVMQVCPFFEAEVAENSLRLIKNVSITKTWFFKLLQVARLMAYPETSNRHQNFSLALRQPQPLKSGIPT